MNPKRSPSTLVPDDEKRTDLISRYRKQIDPALKLCHDAPSNRFFEKPECLTVADTASLLKISTRSVERLLHTGEIRGRKAGRRWIIPRVNVAEWLAQ